MLPVTAILYILYTVREREHIWRDATAVERWCGVLMAAMLTYGVASLPRALGFTHTFRRLFNLCFDLCYFFLLLRLCRDRRIRRASTLACAGSAVLLFLLGILQILTAAPYDEVTNPFPFFFFFNEVYMSPDISTANPNDYAAGIIFIAAVLLLAAAANWRRMGRGGHWATAIGFAALYFVVVADQARLVWFSFWILLVGFTLFLLISDRKRLWIPVVSLILISGIWFGTQYRFIMPSIREYAAQLQEYRQAGQPGEGNPEQTAPPKLQIQTKPSQSLDKQFFAANKETGETELREDSSAGVRALLLLHAFNCFRESHGLGVGLGNTETLAPRRNVVPDWADLPQNAIHCFIARIIADFGIFVLIPLCGITLLLLKSVWDTLLRGWKLRNPALIAWTLLYFAVLVAFPFLSTASADSQDMLLMWIYLAIVVLTSAELSTPDSENRPGERKYEARCQA
ncbi:O-antigen ligase family protein [uncultured Oscillibacter sp.]|uniref:O-antigen ligase family protein n=1 Tax=uncultured Oscillibacter sp. TaxID=876091 RepID=UPI002637E4EA|nr:O-antigen ligase family protein [uncultured Oscillibacter sp.]